MEKGRGCEEQQGEVCGRVWKEEKEWRNAVIKMQSQKIKKKKNLGNILQIWKILLLNSLS